MIRSITILSLVIIMIIAGCSEVDKDEYIKEHQDLPEEEPENFIFAGMINENPGLYKYNIKEKSYSVFWSAGNEKVVELSSSPDHRVSYFLTAGDFGKTGSVPFITKVKLYFINESGQVSFIENIGRGLQVISYWNENRYSLIINSLDKTIPNYLIQRTRIFNSFGRKVQDEEVTYDITKQEYPFPSRGVFKSVSRDGNYKISASGTDKISVSIIDNENEKDFIASVNYPLNEIIWKKNYLFISASGAEVNEPGKLPELLIYSISKKKILQRWKGRGIGNFIVNGELIVFDMGLDTDSYIIVYDYISGKVFDEIKIKNGSGIRNVSLLMN